MQFWAMVTICRIQCYVPCISPPSISDQLKSKVGRLNKYVRLQWLCLHFHFWNRVCSHSSCRGVQKVVIPLPFGCYYGLWHCWCQRFYQMNLSMSQSDYKFVSCDCWFSVPLFQIRFLHFCWPMPQDSTTITVARYHSVMEKKVSFINLIFMNG